MRFPKSDEIPPRLRLLRGIHTYKEAARKAGFTAGDWHNWEKGKHVPTPGSARKIAAAYDVDPEWILIGEGQGPRKDQISLVQEGPELYGTLDRADQKLLKEVEELLRDADDDIKRHLRNQIKLLRRVQRASKKRVSGED